LCFGEPQPPPQGPPATNLGPLWPFSLVQASQVAFLVLNTQVQISQAALASNHAETSRFGERSRLVQRRMTR
jgi:hypothetical protein